MTPAPIPLDPRSWPLAFKAPALVALFMVAVSVVVTQAVLARLKDTQERHLSALSRVYLDGLATAIVPYVLREDVWDIYDAIERSTAAEHGFGPALVAVVDARGHVLAATDPTRYPIGAHLVDHPALTLADPSPIVDQTAELAHARRALIHQDRPIGTILTTYKVGYLLRERAEVLGTLIATNALISLLLAAVAYAVIRRMLRPLDQLSLHIGGTNAGDMRPIPVDPAGAPGGEFARLFARFNALAEAVREREALAERLAREERLASLGRLAAGMAHEINNPLGGLFNTIDTLKKHGDSTAVRATALDLIERGLRGIRDVVRAALATHRTDREQRWLISDDLDDLKLLVGPEVARKRVILEWSTVAFGELALPAAPVRQILLNLVLNAIRAVPDAGRVGVAVTDQSGGLLLEVDDDGPGLPGEGVAILTGQARSTPLLGAGGGLGLWIVQRIVQDLGGTIQVDTGGLGGARITVTLPFAREQEQRHVA